MSGTTTRKARFITVVAVAVGLAGCGSDEAPDAAGTRAAEDAVTSVETVESASNVATTAAPAPAVTPQPGVTGQAEVKTEPEPAPAGETSASAADAEPAAPQTETVAKPAPAAQTPPASESEPEPEPEPKPKPKAVARSASHVATINFFEAMLNGEEDVAMTLVHGTDAQKQAVRALTRFQKAGIAFKAKFLSAYGEAAWETFNDPEHLPEPATSARPPFNASVTVFDPRDLEQIKLYQPQEEGDVAVYPSEAGEMRLVRKDGQWRVDAATVLPTRDDDPAPAEKMMTDRATQISRFAGAIGMDGVSADDIDVELSRAIIEASYGIDIPEPHRFDVSKLK